MKKGSLDLKELSLAALVAVVMVALLCFSFPPFDLGELAYVALVPWLLWSMRGAGRWFRWGVAVVIAILFWFVCLVWLRHVTWGGLMVLSCLLAVFMVAWLWVAAKIFPWMMASGLWVRLLGTGCLASFWVVLEWLRSFVLTGFPWAPLALTQWKRAVMLAPAQWTGAYGVSFILVCANVSLASYAYGVVQRSQRLESIVPRRRWICGEFVLTLLLVAAAVLVYLESLPGRNASAYLTMDVGVVQPYTPAEVKWDAQQAEETLMDLQRLTRWAALAQPDLLLWPEAATPWPAYGDGAMRHWLEQLVAEVQVPILGGNLAKTDKGWHNIVCWLDQEKGLLPQYYAKRKLVPFGEYVPARQWLPFVNKVVPFDNDILFGEGSQLFDWSQGETTVQWGALVCYEDIFSHLAVESVRDGADVLFVATNNAWYGEEAGAYQHAAHAVLRAVETRRPVVRAGNGGWSGWVDEWGRIRDVVVNDEGSIYFQGAGQLQVALSDQWRDTQTFYVRYGDVFVYGCLFFGVISMMIYYRTRRSDVDAS